MGKYIVELESGTHIFVLGPEGIVHIGEPDVVYETVDGMQIGDAVINAKPYAEPDLEQVKRDYDAWYEKGLVDAWEAARKISLAKIDGGFSWESMNNMFGTDSPSKIYKTFTASEAIEKIRQYEQEKEEQIQVGDEVERILNGEVDSKAVFLEDNEGYYHCLFWTGCCFTTLSYPKKQFRKTGRHFDEFAAVLEKMRGEQE